MLAKDIKTGTVVVFEGNPVDHRRDFGSVSFGPWCRDPLQVSGSQCVDRNKVDITLKGTDPLNEADFSRRNVQLMYSDATHMFLMDQEDFHQYELPLADLEEQIPYITEGLEGMRALIYNDMCVGLDIPAAVDLKIVQTDPSVKGNSATSRTKPATLETGLIVQVPNTSRKGKPFASTRRTGEFLSRA